MLEFIKRRLALSETKGFDAVKSKECRHIRKEEDCKQIDEGDKGEFVGLSFSGGGIRSASFCLGVLQALSYHKWLKYIDYLSTVSGGGYIGTSWSWFRKQMLDETGNDEESDAEEATGDRNSDEEKPYFFPFDTEYGLRKDALKEGAKESEEDELKNRAQILRHLRQHAKYLTPGHGHDFATLVWVALRGLTQSVVVYGPLIVFIVWAIEALDAFEEPTADWVLDTGWPALNEILTGVMIPGAPWLIQMAIWLMLLLALAAILYGFASRLFGSMLERWDDWPERWYRWRYVLEGLFGGTIKFVIIPLLILGTLPLVSEWIDPGWKALMKDPKADTGQGGGVIGAISTIVGFLTSMGVFKRTKTDGNAKLSPTVIGTLAATLVIYGLLMMAYSIGLTIDPLWLFGLVGAALVVGWIVDINRVSMHRYYRDRLMETFMPNWKLDPEPRATQAESTWLHDLETLKEDRKRPYHIINANVVLVGSRNRKFKARGGDNFILSPLYCGSQATGWVPTRDLLKGKLSLATAMAISGAAANPNTGVAGEGPTRSRAISFLMSFLNVRLGFWIPNSKKPRDREEELRDQEEESKDQKGKRRDRRRWLFNTGSRFLDLFKPRVPNLLWPGIPALIQTTYDEYDRHAELTDGGHFENLGLYELVRRKCRVIIVCDAGADPDFGFADLSNAIEKVRADFGAIVDLSSDRIKDLIPVSPSDEDGDGAYQPPYAKRGFVVARIKYPRKEGMKRDEVDGVLVYLKTTFFPELAAELHGYKASHNNFPDQPTSDQFFDEKQFEAYRELGYKIGYDAVEAMAGRLRGLPTEERKLLELMRKILRKRWPEGVG
jgi:hypothetical protein